MAITLPFMLLSFSCLYHLTNSSDLERVAAGVLSIHRPLSGRVPNNIRISSTQRTQRDVHDSLDDVLDGYGNTIPQLPAQANWLISSSVTRKHHNKHIPKIINKIYFSKDGQYPAHVSTEIKQAHLTWSNMNPGYEIRYYNLITARQYLRKHFHPVFLRAFDW